jgi:PHP domain-containing protein
VRWLAGDHHIHTKYSPDGLYRVVDHVRRAMSFGLQWMVITDHGSVPHVRIGLETVNRDIRAARAEFPNMLLFQGMEWTIPAADHGTVFVHPGDGEAAVLKEFATAFDCATNGATASTPANEVLAIAGLNFLAGAVAGGRVADALFIANHPAGKGLDSPHELRAWRDAEPHISVGMEAAPGHQAKGIRRPSGPGRHRGSYDKSPGFDSFPGYPLESYRTYGGFDWMTATVGGVWDSMLAEGRPWWITVNSDVHNVHGDVASYDRGPDSDFERDGFHSDPPSASPNMGHGDFWPGQYSRTHVGARDVSYAAVMEGIRRGRVWADHGRLVDGLDVRLRVKGTGTGVTLGGTLRVARGQGVELVVSIGLATKPNGSRVVPVLARVDVIAGDVTGPVADRDAFTAPYTRVVRSYDTTTATGGVTLTYDIGAIDRPMYFRIRGTDGNRTAPGLLGADIDPAGPARDVPGDADPWQDLWFYTNPIWVLPC